MKKINVLGLCLVCAGLFFTACQKDELAKPSGGLEQVTPRAHDCDLNCLEENTGNAFSHTQSVTVMYGGMCQCNNTKTLSVEVWNTLTTIEYRLLLTTNAMSAGNLQYFNETTNTWVSLGALTNNVVFPVSRPLPSGWEACDVVIEQWRQTGGGPDATLGAVPYSLVGPCGCEYDGNSLTGVAGAGSCDDTRSATYTFSSEDGEDYIKFQGGLTNFTGDDATVTVTGGTLIDQDQWTPGQSSNRIIRVEASLDACEEMTIHIVWNSSNGDSLITGEWTAEDENGDLLAPAVAALICQ